MNYKNNHQQNDINQSLDLSQDYIAVAQNYLPNDILHHSQHHSHGIKKLDVNYAQSKDQNLLIQVYGDSSSTQTTLMQPIMAQKYTEYAHHMNEDGQMIVNNDDSDGDFDELDLHKKPSKHVKQNLPHKKRIAKKLNSNQPYSNEYSMIMPSSLPVVTQPLFECSICGVGIPDQLQFFVHLKGHYEPPQMQMEVKRKDSIEAEEIAMMEHRHHHHQDSVHVVNENLIKSLGESPENIKNEEIPPNVMDEFNEFSEPEDMMEDLRKEVEKVVETIADNDCDQQHWNYQVPDEIEEETDEHNDDLQLYSENLIQSNPNSIDSTYDEIDQADNHPAMIDQTTDTRGYDSEDDDDVPLEQVKQSLQKFSAKSEPETKKPQSEDDKEDLELTECLKKIHNFKCSILSCGKAFNSRTALGYHLKTHTTERRYVCDQVSLRERWESYRVGKTG